LVLLPSSTSCSKLRAAGIAAGLLRGAHRLGEREELGRVALDVQSDWPPRGARAARLALHLGDPVGHERLGRSHHHLVGQHLYRQHLVALGVGRAHGVGDLADVDLERIDAQVVSPARRKVLRERLDDRAACRRFRASWPRWPAGPAACCELSACEHRAMVRGFHRRK
jgi:hypothetical protein